MVLMNLTVLMTFLASILNFYIKILCLTFSSLYTIIPFFIWEINALDLKSHSILNWSMKTVKPSTVLL